MKTFRNVAIFILGFFAVGIISLCILYNVNVSAVDKNDDNKIEITIEKGMTKKQVGELLEDKGLIKSSTFFSIYLKLFGSKDFKATVYYLSRDMDVKEIIKTLEEGNSFNPNQVVIQFKEGINIRKVAEIISKNTNNSYDDVLSLLKNEEYLNKLIDKYWFIDKSIKNDKLYYSLEGYLFPDTYYLDNKDVKVEDIFKKMLDKMESVLSVYKEDIEKSKFTPHEILTLASIIEKEGKIRDFDNISSVFYNRLEKGINLGSCATAYYGMGMDFNEVGIATSEMMNSDNEYNTYKIKALPIGAISLPSKEAIKSAVHPAKTNYLFFLSDNSLNTYFFETYSEHQKKQRELINEGKWYR